MRLPDQYNAAANLLGSTLNGRWHVVERITPDPIGTGGLFSINYRVQDNGGRKAFLKVIDLAGAMADIDTLNAATSAFLFERDLVAMCGQQGMSRVITALDSGQTQFDGYLLPQVNFIVFELASQDVRVALSRIEQIDNVFRLQILHDMALGLRQLHQRQVAHQDFKPSNVLVLAEGASDRGKIGDLGRAFRADARSIHDDLIRPGDFTYAPPEQLYGYTYPDVRHRRFAADLYQMGSLASFLFTGMTMNARLGSKIDPEFHWLTFGDGYLAVLPYLNELYFSVLEGLRSDLPISLSKDLGTMIGYLCSPDATRRGHPRNRVGNQNPVALDRVVSALDLMMKREIIALARGL